METRDIKVLISILIDFIESKNPMDFSRLILNEKPYKSCSALCGVINYLKLEEIISQQEYYLIHSFLEDEILNEVYPGFESIYSESINNHTDTKSAYFFPKTRWFIRIKWLNEVLKRLVQINDIDEIPCTEEKQNKEN